MQLFGNRWAYHVGNRLIYVDNAFSSRGWTQERLIIDDEVAKHTQGWLVLRRKFSEPWLSAIDGKMLKLLMRSRLHGIDTILTLEDEEIEPTAMFRTAWTGPKGSWPDLQSWEPWDGSWPLDYDEWTKHHT